MEAKMSRARDRVSPRDRELRRAMERVGYRFRRDTGWIEYHPPSTLWARVKAAVRAFLLGRWG